MLELKAEKRTIVGKNLKTLRKRGFLPAVVYGPKVKSSPVTVPLAEFSHIWKKAGKSTLVSLVMEGSLDESTETSAVRVPTKASGERAKKHSVLIHDVLRDPLTGQPLHVDFYAVEMTRLVTAKIPLHFEGESTAVKELGGVLVRTLHEVEVEALPMNLPHEFIVDISVLKTFTDTIKVKDLPRSPKVEMLADAEDMVALVEPPRSEAEFVALKEKTEAEAIEHITVVAEEKKKEKVTEEPVEGKVKE